nr:GTPase HflX [Candidatus Dependentiae bacterium]
MKKECVFDPLAPTCSVLLLGVHAPYNRTPNIEGYFQEFVNLAKSNGLPTDITMFMRIRDIDSAYFITKGKLEEVKKMCDEHNIDHVVISEPLSVQQERNLSDYLHCKVFDRTQLILEIFEKAADSAEGKTQVQIAMLQHKKSRVAGHGVHMSQQAGILGLRSGAGETAKERELRHLENLILKLRKQLVQIEKVRQTQRKRRLESNLPLMCLIGYTNAGKSSILNALTKSDVLAEDKLFATLDTTTRELYINNAKVGLISDTVGFIQNLPHNLINAFKSTLAELQYANLLIEVVDASDPNWESHIEIVRNILNDLDLQHKEILY